MTLGAGVVGFGVMGRTHAAGYAAAAAAGLPVALRAVAGSVIGRPPAGCEVERTETLLARRDIALVSICTHTDSHVALAEAALAAGKHVLVEKPVALRSAAVSRLAATARTAGLVCMPAMCMRFWPGWPWLRDLTRSGRYGAVKAAEFERIAAEPAWGGGFYRDPARSGSALFDLHIHDVDFIRWCFGDPAGVRSEGRPSDVTTTYDYGPGCRVTARGAWLADPETPFRMRYSVRFDHAEARFDLAEADPPQLRQGDSWESVSQDAGSAYDAEVRHFVELATGRVSTPVATLDEAVAVTRILEAESASLESGGSVAPRVTPG